jgi:hypothetical protein
MDYYECNPVFPKRNALTLLVCSRKIVQIPGASLPCLYPNLSLLPPVSQEFHRQQVNVKK